MLKDMQVLGNSQVLDQEDSAFCAPYDLAYVQRDGYCQGRNTSRGDGDFRLPVAPQRTGLHHPGSTGADYTGGLWFFTVNGDVYPEFPAPAATGELWRIVNAGASRTYDLSCATIRPEPRSPFKIVSLNGASLAPPAGTTAVGSWPQRQDSSGDHPMPGPDDASIFHDTALRHASGDVPRRARRDLGHSAIAFRNTAD